MPVRDVYNKLKVAVVGTKTSDIDLKLDQAVKDIVAYKSNSGRNGYIDLVKSLISKSGSIDLGQNLFQQGTTPASFGQGGRLLRYKAYEAIVSHINYCQRALDVLTDNILSPDDITKVSLEVNSKTYIEGEKNSESNVNDVKEIVKKLKLEERLDLIVKNTLHFGDFFCEVADAKTALTSKSAFLSENYITEVETLLQKRKLDTITEKIDNKDFKIILDYSSVDDDKSKSSVLTNDSGNSKENSTRPEDLHLLFYDAKRVVKLQSDMFPVCFGYLIFPTTVISPQLMIQNQIVNSICQQILKSVQSRIPTLKDEFINTRDLQDIVGSMIKETDYTKAMNVRYVPPDRIQHFTRPATKFYPYGESIFDPCQFNAKVLIAMEVALTMLRLNRSIEKRKIGVEIGLPRDAKKAIEKLKEEFKRRKVSLDSFGSVDTIPGLVSSFEDIFIPQKDGKAYVDVSTWNEGMADTRSKIDELKFIRDSIVASLGVPAPFLSLEENISNKNQLSEENVLFARTIVNHQKYLTHQVQELIVKIYNILDPDKALTILDNVQIGFPAPKSLQFERESAYMTNLANLVETLERIGIPKEWSKKHYLTGINWKEVEEYKIDDKINKSLRTSNKDYGEGDDAMSMGGGLATMGMPMGIGGNIPPGSEGGGLV